MPRFLGKLRSTGGGLAETPVGGMLDFAGFADPDANWMLAEGRPISRTTYLECFDAITIRRVGTTTSGSAVVTGLPSTAFLVAGMAVEGTGIPAGATIASVNSGTQITLSGNATASGSPTLRFLPWGRGDGAATFNIPDSRDVMFIGADDMGTARGARGLLTGGNVRHPGQQGGAENHPGQSFTMPDHGHNGSTPDHVHYPGTLYVPEYNAGGGLSTNRGTSSHPSLTGANEGVAYTRHQHGSLNGNTSGSDRSLAFTTGGVNESRNGTTGAGSSMQPYGVATKIVRVR